MTWALHHSDTRAARTERTARLGQRTTTWPRGLSLVAIVSLLVAAWGAIVPFLGPALGFDAKSTVSWHWSAVNAWLYVLPGAVAFVASLLLLSRSRASWAANRMGLALLGVVVFLAGAWFVVGPWAWTAMGHAAAFSAFKSSFGTFLTLVGYNLGVGVVLAVLAGMMLNAGVSERVLPAAAPTRGVGYPAAGAAAGRPQVTPTPVTPTPVTPTPMTSAGAPMTAPTDTGVVPRITR